MGIKNFTKFQTLIGANEFAKKSKNIILNFCWTANYSNFLEESVGDARFDLADVQFDLKSTKLV